MALIDSGKLKAFKCDGTNCSLVWGTRFHPSEIGAHARRLKNDGWKTVKAGKVFKHYCPNCTPPGGFTASARPGEKKARKAQAEPTRRWRADIDG